LPPGLTFLSELGRGGMGLVYLARDELGREVAVKMISDRSLADPKAQARIKAEAEVLAKVRHSNVVVIHRATTHQSATFLVMEYVPGGSLARRLGGKPMAPREAAKTRSR
jgi:serine/threonine protein kinase